MQALVPPRPSPRLRLPSRARPAPVRASQPPRLASAREIPRRLRARPAPAPARPRAPPPARSTTYAVQCLCAGANLHAADIPSRPRTRATSTLLIFPRARAPAQPPPRSASALRVWPTAHGRGLRSAPARRGEKHSRTTPRNCAAFDTLRPPRACLRILLCPAVRRHSNCCGSKSWSSQSHYNYSAGDYSSSRVRTVPQWGFH
jgi:hypothetical protein